MASGGGDDRIKGESGGLVNTYWATAYNVVEHALHGRPVAAPL